MSPIIGFTRFALFALALSMTASGIAEENHRFARVVLFVEEGSDAPGNYEARLASLALRTEAFIDKWMKHWDYPIERSEIFARKADENIQVSLIKGKLLNPKGRAALPEIRKKAIDGAVQQLGLNPNGPPVIWWIFYDYPEVKGFQGGARGTGGIAINAYPQGEALIDADAELASAVMNEMAIKGTIHEFGHALGLPHIGPRPSRNLGNSLMGPINRTFWQRSGSDDERVYLSEASAAMIRHHPIFRKNRTPDPEMPEEVIVKSLAFNEASGGKSIMVKGMLASGSKAHSVIAYDSERGQFGDYWARTYVSKIDQETGAFSVEISKPYQRGTIFVAFCFESGITTGDGTKPFQQGSSIALRYSGEAGSRRFARD